MHRSTAGFRIDAPDVGKAVGQALGIPGNAAGTSFWPGGLSMVGERGPELVNLPRGAQVIPNNRLGDYAGVGAAPVTINLGGIVIQGNADAATVRQAANDGVLSAIRAMGFA